MVQVGEVDWDDVEVRTGGGGKYLQLKPESTVKLRVVSKPHVMYIHWIEDSKGAQKRVNCSLTNCPVCLSSDDARPQVRYLLKVIVRGEGSQAPAIKLFECGSQILSQLKGLAKDPDWGKLHTYDVKITRGKQGTNPLYQINPVPKTALSDSDKELISQSKEGEHAVNMEEISKPWPPEKIKAIIKGETESSSSKDDDDDDLESVSESSEKKEKGKKKSSEKSSESKEDEEFLDL